MKTIGTTIKECVRKVDALLHYKSRFRSIAIAAAIPVLTSILLTSNASAQSVNVSVDWNNSLQTISPSAWGVDNPGFMVPADTANASWMGLVNAITLKKPLIRIHGWGMLNRGGSSPDAWLNTDGTWNAAKIASALGPVIAAGYTVMIDVPDGPNHNFSTDAIDPDMINNPANIASWLASLVKIVNVDNHFNVKYWEFPNEREPYISTGQMSTLLNSCSVAMKNASPSFPILVGGPATAWLNVGYIQSVVQGCGTNIDFVTCHDYGYGSTLQGDYDGAQFDTGGSGSTIASMRPSVDSVSGGRHIPIFLDEYDIQAGSSAYNKDSDGAIYDILIATGTVHNGGDASQFWEISDNDDNNSLIQNLTTRYPISNYLTMLNQYFYGQEMSATTSNNTLVDKFAAKSTAGSTTTYALVLINRSDSTQTVGLTYTNFTPTSLNKYVIDSTGFSGPTAIGWPVSGGLSMAPRTIAYLIATSGGGGTSGLVSINSGGPASGSFIADADFSGGGTATNWTGTIDTTGATNPAPQAVYQSERYGTNTYTIGGLTSGTNYTVRLHFCENYWTAAGARTFNVSINGISELSNFDIFATAGAAHKAVTRQYTVAANTSGQIVIVYTTVVDNALSSGVEVLASVTPPSAPTGLTASAGNSQVSLSWNASTGATSYTVKRSTVSGSGYATISSPTTTSYTNTGLTNGTTYYFVVSATNAGGTSANSTQASGTPHVSALPIQINAAGPAVSPFVADMDFSGGLTATNWTGAITTTGVTNPAPQAVYQSERYGTSTYTVPGLTSGTNYTVRLHFCENYFTTSGQRTFNVSINGASVLSNFDIYATAGAIHKANVQQFTAAANTSGQIVIVFTTVINNALINGIEVLAASSPPPAFVQVASNNPVSASSIAVPYASAQVAGHLNIVVVGWNNTTGTVSSVTDSAGNTYTRAIGPTVDSDAQQSIYYASNIRAGSNTVTVTMSTSVAYPDVRVLEYSGVTTLDKTAGASGSGTAASSGSATTTAANELIFTANTCDWNTTGVGAGFTTRVTTIDGNIAADRIVSATGSYSGTATLSNTTPWTMQMATFK